MRFVSRDWARAEMKKSVMVILAVIFLGVIGIGYLSSVQIPAPVKTVSKVVPNEELPR